MCNQDHQLYQCNEFLNMSVNDRKAIVFKDRRCYNCLRVDHQVRQCKASNCTKCRKRHHSLLHDEFQGQHGTNPQRNRGENALSTPSVLVGLSKGIINTSLHVQPSVQVILATVVVEVCDGLGNKIRCRTFLDSGSQLSFITSQCVRRLGLNISNVALPISGIVQSSAKSQQCCTTRVSSCFEEVHFNLQLYVLPTITSHLPTQAFSVGTFIIPDYVKTKLADPDYNQPGTIDMLLGAEVFFDILNRL